MTPSSPFDRFVRRRRGLALSPALTLALPVLLCSAGVNAEEPTWSLGVAAGADRGRVECLSGFACDRSSTAWKVVGGVRLSDGIELQATWFDAGRFKGADTAPLGTEFGGDFKVDGLALTAGYRWPLSTQWSASARAGVAAVRARFVYDNDAWGSTRKTTAQPYASVGIAYAVTPRVQVGLDFDMTRFKAYRDRGSLRTLGVAARVEF